VVFKGREPAPAAFLVQLRSYPWLIVATTCIAAFIGQVDASIVQLALPHLELAFGAQLSSVSWVAIGYVLGFASILPVFARLAEMAGRKLMYLLGFGLFGLASALCGLASGLPWLIAFRVLQGFSGAMLGANSIVILVAAVGPARKSRGLGFFAAAQAVGVSLGPALGGLLIDTLNWRWLFWINVPFALAGVIVGWLVVPLSEHLHKDATFDWRGALLLVPALTSILLGLTELHAWGPLSAGTLTCVVAAVVLMTTFIWQERRLRSPLLDLRLFRSPAFSGGALAVVLSYAMLYGMFFGMSFALVRGYHDQPLVAGLRLAIVPVALGLVAPFSGSLCDAHPRLIPVAGMAICLIAVIALSAGMTGAPDSMQMVMVALAVYGAGLGMFIAPNNSATMSAAPADRAGQAGGLLNLLRVFGTGLGVAIASSVLGWSLETATGLHERTIGAPERELLAAVSDVLLALGIFAVLAGTASLLRGGGGTRAVAVTPLSR
jgi:EmrB/QacA subfamily drug resistance transporter